MTRYTVSPLRRPSNFPQDMLRYDNAKPATPADASLIAQYSSFRNPAIPGTEIDLICAGEPNVLRWQSFGWQIVRSI